MRPAANNSAQSRTNPSPGAGPLAEREPTLELPRVSPWLFRAFAGYVRGYLRRHFHALRVARGPALPLDGQQSLLVVLNHPAWWDPLVGIFLAAHFWPRATHYAPIESRALGRYRFFERLGFFGIERGTARGARRFLHLGAACLSSPDSVLWVTAQGDFVDPRERPVSLRGGVGHLAARLSQGVILPLAVEYPFWTERLPEALVRFGEPIQIRANRFPPDQWTRLIAARLESAQDALAADARDRRADRFDTLLAGRAGVGGVYDRWRRCAALLSGQRFTPEHEG